jgi:hypothetical protein
MLYERAGEPMTMRLFPGAGHILIEVGNELTDLVSDWLLQKVWLTCSVADCDAGAP